MKRHPVGSKDVLRLATPAQVNGADELARAARYVAGMARDADDARDLLDALGLTPVERAEAAGA